MSSTKLPLYVLYSFEFDTRVRDRMRTLHDAILVGIGTALNDNPQLNSKPVESVYARIREPLNA